MTAVTSSWQCGAGLTFVTGWATHAREPYAADLLVALMAEFPGVSFVVAFDGFFYESSELEDGDRLCTLSLWVTARRRNDSHADSYVHCTKECVIGFITAWVSGYRLGLRSRA